MFLITTMLCLLSITGCKKNITWQQAYQEVLRNKQFTDGTVIDAQSFSLFDFDIDGIPELLLYGKFQKLNENLVDKYVIAKYENGCVQIAYTAENIMLNAYYDTETADLILSYPNSPGNPVEKKKYINGEFITVWHAHSEDGYVVTTYDEDGKEETQLLEEDYTDTIEILSEIRHDFIYFELTKENVDAIITYE